MDPVTAFIVNTAIVIGINLIMMALTAQNVEQGKLDRLDVDAASYGTPIPFIYGKQLVTLQTVWIKDNKLIEVRREDDIGPFGLGGTITYYDYFVTCVMVACQGPATLSRLWMNDTLYEDRQTTLVGAGSPFFSRFQQVNLDTVSATDILGQGLTAQGLANRSTWFRGELEQGPPGAMIASLGVQASPGMNGLAGIQLVRYPLADFGNSIPTLKAEVIVAGPGSEAYTLIPPAAYNTNTGPGSLDPNGRLWVVGINRILVMDPLVNLVLKDVDYNGDVVNGVTVDFDHSNVFEDLSPIFLTDETGTWNNKVFIGSGDDSGASTAGWIVEWPSMNIRPVLIPTVPGAIEASSAIVNGYMASIITTSVFTGPQIVMLNMVNAGSPTFTYSWGGSLPVLFGGGFLAYNLSKFFRLAIISQKVVAISFYGQQDVITGMQHFAVIDASSGTAVIRWQKRADDYGATADLEGAYTGMFYSAAAGGLVIMMSNEFGIVVNEDTGEKLYDLPFTPRTFGGHNGTALQIAQSGLDQAWIGARLTGGVDGYVLYDFLSRTVVRTLTETEAGTNDQILTGVYTTNRWNGVLLVNENADETVIAFFDTASGTGVTVRSVIEDLVVRSKLDSSFIDATLAVGTISGYRLDRKTSLSAIEDLITIFDYEMIDVGYKYIVRPRNETPVLTIDLDDMGADTGKPTKNWLSYKLSSATELPKRVEVSFADTLGDYENNVAYAFFPSDTIQGNRIARVSTALAMNVTEAKNASFKVASGMYRRRVMADTSLPIHKYGLLAVGDVVTFVDNGDSMNWKVETIGGAYALQFGMTRSDPLEIALNTVGAERGVPPAVIPAIAETEILFVDSHATRIEMDQFLAAGQTQKDWAHLGVFRALFSYTWSGAAVLQSTDGGVSWASLYTEDTEARYGKLASPLNPSAVFEVMDETPITVTTTQVLTSATLAQLTDSRRLNIAKIRCANTTEWEIIQYATVIDNLDGTLTLTGLLRGCQGTEHLISQHGSGAGELIIFETADDTTSLTKQLDVGDFNAAFRFGALTSGLSSQYLLDTGTFNYAARGMRCWSPAQLAAVNNSGTVDISWLRRDKYASSSNIDGGDIDLSETGVSFRLRILQTSTGDVKRTETILNVGAFAYTSAMRTTDGTTGMACTIEVCQNNANIGPGVPATINFTMP